MLPDHPLAPTDAYDWYKIFCEGASYARQWEWVRRQQDPLARESQLGLRISFDAQELRAEAQATPSGDGMEASYRAFEASGGFMVYPGAPCAAGLEGFVAAARAQASRVPALLMAKGRIEALKNPEKIAVVGLRNGGIRCLKKAQKIAYRLAQLGYVVLSGYARGVDTYAHIGALEGGGDTIMVLPHSLKRILEGGTYLRKEMRDLLPSEQITACALWLSQFNFSQRYTRYTPLHRNRTLAALSGAMVVVCASHGGGSYQAAKEAVRMKRPVHVWKPTLHCPQGNQRLEHKYHAIPFGSVEELEEHMASRKSDRTVGYKSRE